MTRSAAFEEVSIGKLVQEKVSIPQDVLQSGLDTLNKIHIKIQKTKREVIRDDMSYKDLYFTVKTVIDYCIQEKIEEECLIKYLASGGEPK